jgi:NitT/TauT family transport system substrate-binding protein
VRKRSLTAIVGVVLLALSACGGRPPASTGQLESIRLPMGFIPNVQYAPFYVADASGYFADAGVKVEFDYSSETDGVALVGSGELPFALASGEQVLLAREQGAPVVYVMAWWQDFPVAVAALAESGIQSPADLVGARVGIPGRYGASYIGYQALMRAAGLDPESAQLDAIGFNQVEALTTGADQAVVVYANNEPIQLRADGYDLNVMRVSDYVQLASNGLVTNQRTLDQSPELVRAMVGAVRAGLADTLNDPESAYQISTDYVEGLAEADRNVQMQVLNTSIEFWRADPLGASNPVAWQNMQDVLIEMGLMNQATDLSQAFTNRFVTGP